MRTVILITLMFSVFLTGCRFLNTNVNNYYLTVKFNSADNNSELKNISAVIGTDKFWWSDIKANEEKKITLSTEKNPVNTLSVFYYINGQEKIWQSENLAEDADYRFILEIDAAGTVKERSCRLPCEL